MRLHDAVVVAWLLVVSKNSIRSRLRLLSMYGESIGRNEFVRGTTADTEIGIVLIEVKLKTLWVRVALSLRRLGCLALLELQYTMLNDALALVDVLQILLELLAVLLGVEILLLRRHQVCKYSIIEYEIVLVAKLERPALE